MILCSRSGREVVGGCANAVYVSVFSGMDRRHRGIGCSAAAFLQMHGTCLGLEALANVIAGGKRVLS